MVLFYFTFQCLSLIGDIPATVRPPVIESVKSDKSRYLDKTVINLDRIQNSDKSLEGHDGLAKTRLKLSRNRSSTGFAAGAR